MTPLRALRLAICMPKKNALADALDALVLDPDRSRLLSLLSMERGVFYPVSNFIGDVQRYRDIFVLWGQSYDEPAYVDLILLDTRTLMLKYATCNLEELDTPKSHVTAGG